VLKVLLIGAAGQLGSDIVRTNPGMVELFPLNKKDLDITKRDRTITTIREIKPDLLINTAAYVRVDDAEDNVEDTFKINAYGVKNLVDACNIISADIVHISTDYVFDGKKKQIPYDEYDIPNPLNVYGITKYAGELFVKNYALKPYIIRTASLYGKSGAIGKGGNFVFTVLDRIKKGLSMSIVNDIYMSPTCTYDLSLQIWSLIIEKSPYGLYHIANSGHCSWYEFATMISSISGFKGKIEPISNEKYPSKAKRPIWTPLISTRGIKMRAWEEALEVFIRETL